jgi:hypothetical protein
VFASIGNYLKLHGWRAGEPVMVAADVSGARLEGVELSKLDLGETVGSLRERGVRFDTGLPAEARAVLIELAGSAGPEYRVGFNNFHAITRYNRSALYASAVNDLAESLATAVLTPPADNLSAAPEVTSPPPAEVPTPIETTEPKPVAAPCPVEAPAPPEAADPATGTP